MNPASRVETEFKEEWLKNGHGEYTRLESEKDFLEIEKNSERVILYYLCSSINDNVIDKHLDFLAKKHLESKFIKLEVDKTQFLCDYLKIEKSPCIVLCKNSKPIDYVLNLGELLDDDYSRDMLEWKFAKSGMINYDGDLSLPTKSAAKTPQHSIFTLVQKNIADSSDTDRDVLGDN